MHGETTALDGGGNHFHIKGLDPAAMDELIHEAENAPPEVEIMVGMVPVREGTYSRVGKSQDFEWDGWVVKHG